MYSGVPDSYSRKHTSVIVPNTIVSRLPGASSLRMLLFATCNLTFLLLGLKHHLDVLSQPLKLLIQTKAYLGRTLLRLPGPPEANISEHHGKLRPSHTFYARTHISSESSYSQSQIKRLSLPRPSSFTERSRQQGYIWQGRHGPIPV